MTTEANKRGLFLNVDDSDVWVQHTDGNILAKWSLENLASRLDKKTKNILLVTAKVKKENGNESFFYDHAIWCHNGIHSSNLKKLFEDGKLKIDLRLHKEKEDGKIRNHGTAFRIYENNLQYLYQTIEEILF